MAEIEVRVAENVMEACARTSSVKRCVFTSSLSACMWQNNAQSETSPVINHESWSSESFCIEKKVNFNNAIALDFFTLFYFMFKTSYTTCLYDITLSLWQLWYALGKLRAEKTAWRIANERGLKLTTICPALITGPEFYQRNPTATIAYLKGTMLPKSLPQSKKLN